MPALLHMCPFSFPFSRAASQAVEFLCFSLFAAGHVSPILHALLTLSMAAGSKPSRGIPLLLPIRSRPCQPYSACTLGSLHGRRQQSQVVKFLCFFLFTAGMSALLCMHSWLSPWPRAANQVVKFLCFFLFKERRESFIYAANVWGRPPRT